MKEATEKEIAGLSEKLRMYEDINLELEKNLMSLAEDFNKQDERVVTM